MTIRSFRDLRVWQAAMDLVEHVYRITDSFPKAETYGLTSQIRRAAVSVPSNIAEGNARRIPVNTCIMRRTHRAHWRKL